jgi:hypothetical protein
VIDTEVVLRVATRFEGAEVIARDEDALRVAEGLSAQLVVAGSFQLVAGLLHADARLLTVGAEAGAPAHQIVADAAYPTGYSTLIEKLTKAVVAGSKLSRAPLSAAGASAASGGTRSPVAFQLYVRGTRKAREGDESSLSEAINLFREAIALDPTYADALAAKSEALTKLSDIRKRAGANADALDRDAANDADAAVGIAPGSGKARRARARSQASRGDYAGAAQSAAEAMRAWPGDAESALDRLRALGRGGLTRTPETDRLLLARPDLALFVPELPKVLTVNNSDMPVTVRFIPDGGRPYPPVSIGAGGSRVVPLFAGAYRIVFETAFGSRERQEVLEAGSDYDLVFTGDFPKAAFIFINGGNSRLQVGVSGPLRTSLSLSPRETRRLVVPPGSYSVTGRVGSATTTGQFQLEGGDEETLTYTYTGGRSPVFNPSVLVITNNGNGALSVNISGPRRLSFSVPPGTRTVTLPAGTYTIRVACGRDTESDEYELSPDEETTLEYTCRRWVVYR